VGTWQYNGDVSLTNGGTFVRDQGHHFDVVEVVDIDSGCGARGMVLIDVGNTYFDRKQIRAAVEDAGDRSIYKLGRTTRAQSRLMVGYALWHWQKDIDSSTVLVTDSPYTDACQHCGEHIVYRNDQWEHAGEALLGEFVPCDGGLTNAAPKAPVAYENGAESWPGLLADDWQRYADGDDGIKRYLNDHCDISAEDMAN
jgi:hypothetical protein